MNLDNTKDSKSLIEAENIKLLSLMVSPEFKLYLLNNDSIPKAIDMYERNEIQIKYLQEKLLKEHQLPTGKIGLDSLQNAMYAYRNKLKSQADKDAYRFPKIIKMLNAMTSPRAGDDIWDGGELQGVTVSGKRCKKIYFKSDQMQNVYDTKRAENPNCVVNNIGLFKQIQSFDRLYSVGEHCLSREQYRLYQWESEKLSSIINNEFNQCSRDKKPNDFPNQIIPSVHSKDIEDNLKDYPCAQSIVKQLPNLKNDIAKLINEVFGKNNKVNIVFSAVEDYRGNELDGKFLSHNFTQEDKLGEGSYLIGLNPDILDYASKEYILVTMYHEALHAFLAYEKGRLGVADFSNQYPNFLESTDGHFVAQDQKHLKLANNINDLTNAIISFNPEFDRKRAEILSKAGIFGLKPNESTINNQERDTRLGQSQGTKCK